MTPGLNTAFNGTKVSHDDPQALCKTLLEGTLANGIFSGTLEFVRRGRALVLGKTWVPYLCCRSAPAALSYLLW